MILSIVRDEPTASGLDRFKAAQERGGAFATALAEIETGHKRSHWIWYVFPQLDGMGSSPAAQTYGLRGVEEATAFLADATLGPRLLTIAGAAAEQLRRGVALETLMGSSIDVLKLISSMTLFHAVAERTGHPLRDVAEQILMAAERAGHERCAHTLARLGPQR